MSTITGCTKQFVRYLRHTRAVSALEYAILVGVSAVVLFAAYETFKNTIKTTVTALARQLTGG